MDDRDVLAGSHRAGVVGSQTGTGFYVESERAQTKNLKIPPRLQKYDSSRQITEEQIAEKQMQAQERKKKHDEERAQRAKQVREEAIQIDQQMRTALKKGPVQDKPRWFEKALPK